MEERKLSSYKLALLLDISKSTVTNYLNGKTTQPHINIMERICEEFSINRLWLETGNGPKEMIKEPTPGYRKIAVESEEYDMLLMNNLKNRLRQLREEIKKVKEENKRLKRK